MNNTTPSVALLGGGYGRDWWYDVLPNALYYAICDVFPNVDGAEKIQKSIAEQFVKADSVLIVTIFSCQQRVRHSEKIREQFTQVSGRK